MMASSTNPRRSTPQPMTTTTTNDYYYGGRGVLGGNEISRDQHQGEGYGGGGGDLYDGQYHYDGLPGVILVEVV